MSREDFEALVVDELDALPDEMVDGLDNVIFVVEDRPEDGSLDLLGIDEGFALTDRGQYGFGELPDRIVLFHDSPPQGRGNAEVLGAGLGLFPGVVVLPHARRRLMLHDSGRISVFARRFAGATCIALDERCWLKFAGARWTSGPSTFQLCSDGRLVDPASSNPPHDRPEPAAIRA